MYLLYGMPKSLSGKPSAGTDFYFTGMYQMRKLCCCLSEKLFEVEKKRLKVPLFKKSTHTISRTIP